MSDEFLGKTTSNEGSQLWLTAQQQVVSPVSKQQTFAMSPDPEQKGIEPMATPVQSMKYMYIAVHMPAGLGARVRGFGIVPRSGRADSCVRGFLSV